MAKNTSRSMNESLRSGAVDGKYRAIVPNSEGSPMNIEATYTTRQSLSLPYYGIGEPRMIEVPGQNSYGPKPHGQSNKFERLEDSSILGETW